MKPAVVGKRRPQSGAAAEPFARGVRVTALGFAPGHWQWLRRFPKLKGDSTRFVSEDRDRG